MYANIRFRVQGGAVVDQSHLYSLRLEDALPHHRVQVTVQAIPVSHDCTEEEAIDAINGAFSMSRRDVWFECTVPQFLEVVMTLKLVHGKTKHLARALNVVGSVFEAVDTDKDGYITFDEADDVISSLGMDSDFNIDVEALLLNAGATIKGQALGLAGFERALQLLLRQHFLRGINGPWMPQEKAQVPQEGLVAGPAGDAAGSEDDHSVRHLLDQVLMKALYGL